jgi:hypothetical protein
MPWGGAKGRLNQGPPRPDEEKGFSQVPLFSGESIVGTITDITSLPSWSKGTMGFGDSDEDRPDDCSPRSRMAATSPVPSERTLAGTARSARPGHPKGAVCSVRLPEIQTRSRMPLVPAAFLSSGSVVSRTSAVPSIVAMAKLSARDKKGRFTFQFPAPIEI